MLSLLYFSNKLAWVVVCEFERYNILLVIGYFHKFFVGGCCLGSQYYCLANIKLVKGDSTALSTVRGVNWLWTNLYVFLSFYL